LNLIATMMNQLQLLYSIWQATKNGLTLLIAFSE